MASPKFMNIKYTLYGRDKFNIGNDDDNGDYSSDESSNNLKQAYQKSRFRPDKVTDKVKLCNLTKVNFVKSETLSELHVTLHQVARDGNWEILNTFLTNLSSEVAKVQVNQLDESKCSPLHYAARYSHTKVVQLLLEWGADVNISGQDGLTPLHFASRYGCTKTVKQLGKQNTDSPLLACRTVISTLVKFGAFVNCPDDYAMTPLHYAAVRGNVAASAQLLASKNINTEVYDKQSMTPLHCASNYNNPEVVELLLNSGAVPNVNDENMSTPLHLAATTGSKESVVLLLKTVEKFGAEELKDYINEQNCGGSTALHLAVCKGHLEIVDILLDKGANVKAARGNCSQPLHLAAVSGNVTIAMCLLNHGAKVNCLNSNHETPLHKAAAYNADKVMDFLIENGAELECRDNEHFTPLLVAAMQGHEIAIQKLLKAGARIDVVDKMDRTSVFWAAQENHPKALKLLLSSSHGNALINSSNHYDSSPLHIAALRGYVEIVEILLSNNAEIENKNEHEQTPLHMAAKNGQIWVVDLLLSQSKSIVNAQDENADTPLHIASLNGHYKTINLLLNSGANAEARNCHLWTALDCAACRGWKYCCRLLINAGCPVDSVDKSKTTPLHLASREGHKETVKLLLRHGANIAQCNMDDKNCLDLAIDKGHADVAMEILKDRNWMAVLRNESDKNKFGTHQTPLRRLIRYMPDVAEYVFERCVTQNEYSEEHPKLEITYHYEFLDDVFACYRPSLYHLNKSPDEVDSETRFTDLSIYKDSGHVKKNIQPYTDDREVLKYNHPLMLMVTYNRENLLNHRLCQSLLMHKWKNYGRYVYYCDFIVFILFLAFLTSYVVYAVAPCPVTDLNGTERKCCTSSNFTCMPHMGECQRVMKGQFHEVCKNFIYILAILHLLKEIYQIYQNGKKYFNIENFLEWSCYISALIFIADMTECSAKTGIREVWQWELGAISIFTAWMVLVMFISKFPFLGIYVVMFFQILSTFINFSIVFFLFVVAFALAFYLLFQNQDPFESPGEALIKTGVMMIGEIEFDSIFNDDTNEVYFKGPSYLLFVLFLLIMTIIIMNLLVGLAVDDIKGVQEKAELKRLAMKVELVLTVERILPIIALRKCIIRSRTIHPNAWQSLPWYYRIFKTQPSPSTASHKSALLTLKEQQATLSKQLKDIQQTMRLLQKDVKHLQETVNKKLTP